ncbi:MAG: beta-phosphoglucomutase [Clostridiales bacterium]|nr:beta-phosphoglucomutase [Clostridiales bacterium]
MQYKGVIFDLDGVICFTDRFHYLAWKQAVEPLGVYFDEKINDRLRGVSREQSLEIILEKYDGKLSSQEKASLCETKNNIYKQLLTNLSPNDVSEDVMFTLCSLKHRGVPIAIGSSSKNTRFILERLGILEIFDAISDGNGLTKSKPDPEVFLKAANMLQLPPDKCLVVEDAESGIDAGNAGGFTTVGIGVAASYEKSNYKINKLSDILQLKGN